MKTLVTFKSSAFNTDPNIDRYLLGRDIAQWLIDELRSRGIETDTEPRQEDFSPYFNFKLPNEADCQFFVGRMDDGDQWLGGWIKGPAVSPNEINVMHQILSTSPKIQDIKWHEESDFNKGREDLGSPTPQ